MTEEPKKRGRGRPPREKKLLEPEERTKKHDEWNRREHAREIMQRKINAMEAGTWDYELNRMRKSPGRPKGSKNTKIESFAAAKKLEEMGFDPIEKLIESYQEIERDMRAITIKKGKEYQNMPTDDPNRYEFAIKRGSVAYTNMVTQKNKISEILMRYGYQMVPNKEEVDLTNKKPTIIKLDLGDMEDDSTEDEKTTDTSSET